MSIKYIDELQIDNSLGKYAIVDTEDLYLDEENPRFNSVLLFNRPDEVTQSFIISHFIKIAKLSELAKDIGSTKRLYDEEFLSCYIDDKSRVVVLEGNRRTAACKILLNPELLSDTDKGQIVLPTIDDTTRKNISKMKVVIYPDRHEAQAYISAKHTTNEVLSWSSIEKANYYYAEFMRDVSIVQISTAVGDKASDIRDYIRNYKLFKKVFEATQKKFKSLYVEETVILPIVTRCLRRLLTENAQETCQIQVDFDKVKLEYFPLAGLEEIFEKILLLLGEAFFVRPKAKTAVERKLRIDTNVFRVSADDIKKKEQLDEVIIANKQIPGLLALIQEYKELSYGKSVDTNIDKDKIDKLQIATSEDSFENKNQFEYTKKANNQTEVEATNLPQKNVEIFQEKEENGTSITTADGKFYKPNLNVSNILLEKKYLRFSEQESSRFDIEDDIDVCKKIKRLIRELYYADINTTPYTCCLLYRTLLESAAQLGFLRFVGEKKKYNEDDLAGNLNCLNNEFLYTEKSDKISQRCKDNIKACINFTKIVNTLNSYIHYSINLDMNLIISSWGTMKYFIISCLSK